MVDQDIYGRYHSALPTYPLSPYSVLPKDPGYRRPSSSALADWVEDAQMVHTSTKWMKSIDCIIPKP